MLQTSKWRRLCLLCKRGGLERKAESQIPVPSAGPSSLIPGTKKRGESPSDIFLRQNELALSPPGLPPSNAQSHSSGSHLLPAVTWPTSYLVWDIPIGSPTPPPPQTCSSGPAGGGDAEKVGHFCSSSLNPLKLTKKRNPSSANLTAACHVPVSLAWLLLPA